MKTDVVVIGAGISGLATAALLSRQGMSVHVLEQARGIGGYATSFTRNGCRFEAGAHHVGGFAEGDVVDRTLRKLGVRDEISVTVSEPMKARFGSDEVEIPFDLDGLEATMYDVSGDKRESVRAVVTQLKEFSQALVQKDDVKIARFFKMFCSVSFEQYLEGKLNSKRAIGLLSALGPGYAGITASGSAMVMASLLATYHEGAFYVEGGTGTLSELLGRSVRKNGGLIWTATTATRIVLDGQRVTGVEWEHDGETGLLETDVVVCASSLVNLYSMIEMAHGSERLQARMKQLRVGPSAMRLFVVLRGGYVPSASDMAYFPTWDTKYWEPDLCFQSDRHSSGVLPIALLSFPAVLNGVAPQGAHAMTLTILTREQGISNHETFREKLLQIADQIVPGVYDAAVHMELATPRTFAHYTRNNNGSVFGWERSVVQTLRTNALAPKGAFEGLYVVGQWGPTFGVYGGFLSAENAVESIRSATRNINRR